MFFSLPVLMYHSISRFRSYLPRLCVPPELFEEHCRTLASAGWRGISLVEAEEYFLKGRSLPRGTCLFSFDDGYLDNYVYAEPILRRYGHQGVIFPVAGLLQDRDALHPALDDAEDERKTALLGLLDQRDKVWCRGFQVYQPQFCSRLEIARMHKNGNIAAAPHSMEHARRVVSPRFLQVYVPRRHSLSLFGLPPMLVPWGFPFFKLGSALSGRAYVPVPELFELVTNMVPQAPNEAERFLKIPDNVLALKRAIGKLPRLAVLETEREYRNRLAAEFGHCREFFMELLGEPPVSFCWPWGYYSKTALEEGVKAGFRVFFTTGRWANRPGGWRAVHRIAVRGGSGDELLRTVRQASNSLTEFYVGMGAGATHYKKKLKTKFQTLFK